MDGLSKNDALCSGMHRSKNAPYPIVKILNQDAFILFCVFCYKNVARIQQSIQNQTLRVYSENDKIDLIQTDEIK